MWPRGPSHELIGRDREIRELRAVLTSGDQLVTVTGPAGVGKTRLAIDVAQSGRAELGQAHSVDLTTLNEATQVLPALAGALGVEESASEPLPVALRQALASEERFVLLDNFEHVIAAAPELGALLDDAPGLRVLVTSREPLGLLREREYRLQPLALPADPGLADVEALRAVASVALLEQRAQAVDPRFAITAENAAVIAELVIRLDGLPLAIELAAPRLRALSPGELLARLGRRLDMLRSRERDRPPRHRTLRAAIGWSYHLLTPEEAWALRALAVFAAPATLEALTRVAVPPGTQEPAALDLIESLIEKGLLQRVDFGTETRYRLLESIRAFAAERLAVEGEQRPARRRHADYFLDLAEEAEPLLAGAWHPDVFERIGRDFRNLEAVVAYALETRDRDVAWRLGALTFYWWQHGQLSRVHDLSRVLKLIGSLDAVETPSAAAAKISYNAALFASTLGDIDGALRHLERGRKIADAAGDARQWVWMVTLELWIAWITGRYDWIDELEALLDVMPEGADDWSVGAGHLALATLLQSAGRRQDAVDRYTRALPLLTQGTERAGSGVAYVGLCRDRRWRGDLAKAVDLLSRAIEAFRDHPDRQTMPYAIEEAVHLARALRADAGADVQARLVGAAERMRDIVRVPRAAGQVEEWKATKAAVAKALGADAFEAARTAGADLSVHEALAQALDLIHAPAAGGTSPDRSALTPREIEVAALIGAGLTSPEIAERLVMSVHTANTHAAHIREKLALRSRAEIASWATQQGLRPANS